MMDETQIAPKNGAPPVSRARASKPPRRQGRPAASGNGVGRAALVRAARELLQTTAPAKITRLDIARHAGVDPALIRYYFGNKSSLFTEVILEISAEMRDRLSVFSKQKGPVTERLRARIKAFLEIQADNPYFHQLILEQILHKEGSVARKARREMVVSGVEQLGSLLTEGIEADELRGVDPRFLLVSLIGACEFFVTGRPVLEEMFAPSPVPENARDTYGDFVADMVINGLRARG